MIRTLHTGYVQELATSLREGSVALHSDDIVDATTLHTLARTAGALDREEILARVEELQSERDESLSRGKAVGQLSDLVSEEPERVLDTLRDASLSPHLASYVIELLGNDAYARAAYGALERFGPRITGQLVDAMLRPETPAEVRRRVPRLLRKLDDPRAVQGLLHGLRDEAFDVRYRCGQALAELRRSNRDLDLPRDEIMRAIELDVTTEDRDWQHHRLRDEVAAEDQSEIEALLESRDDRSLQHVFTLLSLALDGDAIVLSLRALSSHNENLRGTSLEYLHNVLPEPVRDSLWPRLTDRSQRQRPRAKPTKSSPDELLQTMQSLMIDRDRLDK
jgi:HEAT repeat protein